MPNAYNSFFNNYEKTVLGISECTEHKTKVQFLMHTLKRCEKKIKFAKNWQKISSSMRSQIFPIFLEFSFLTPF